MSNTGKHQTLEQAQADQVEGEALEHDEDIAAEAGDLVPTVGDSCTDCETIRAAHTGKAGAESHVCAKHVPVAEVT